MSTSETLCLSLWCLTLNVLPCPDEEEQAQDQGAQRCRTHLPSRGLEPLLQHDDEHAEVICDISSVADIGQIQESFGCFRG